MSEVHDRLDSWKAIAEYLDRDPTTVMRWAKERGLPVHVVPGEGQRRRAVYAFKTEIDGWLKKREHGTGSSENDPPVAAPTTQPGTAENPGTSDSTRQISESLNAPAPWFQANRTRWATLLAGGILIAVATGAWLRVPPPEPRILAVEQLTNDGIEKQADVVTDGARIYFTEITDAGWVVAQVPTAGGNPVPIARLNRYMAIWDLSPGRSELLLAGGPLFKPQPVWTLPLLGGEPRRLGDILAYSAAWSPDGSTLAYTTDGGVYLSDANGANSRKIVGMDGMLAGLRWSPSGRQLCWGRISSGQETLWLAGRDGKGLRRLATDRNLPSARRPCFWMPDGKHLILSGNDAGHSRLWALRVSSGILGRYENVNPLGPTGVDLTSCAASPDGSTLYCVGQPEVRFQLARLDAQSKQLMPYLPDLTTT